MANIENPRKGTDLRSRVRAAWQAFRSPDVMTHVRAIAQPAVTNATNTTKSAAIHKSLADFLTDEAAWPSINHNQRDKPWPRHREDLSNALEAWRTNPLARRITNLTRDHVWGSGIRPFSKNRVVQKWLDSFWDHPLNHMAERLPVWVDSLTTDGEFFPTFHFNPVDGMTYVRALAAIQVEDLRWQPNDYEALTEIGQRVPGQLDLTWWPTLLTAQPGQSCAGHHAVNRPLGAVRGEGDITPALPWLAAYSDWLSGRVERNDRLTDFYLDVTVKQADQVDDALQRYARPPKRGHFIVHSEGEDIKVIQPSIGGDDARADGIALRTMIAVGGQVPLHWLAEPGEGNSEATSNNMNDVSYRFYATRQTFVRRLIVHTCVTAYQRAAAAGAVRHYRDPGIHASKPDISRTDNEKLARAARDIAEAFAKVIESNLDAEPIIARLIYKFAGEDLDQSELDALIARAVARGKANQKEQPKS